MELGYKIDPLNPLIQSIYAGALICDRDFKSALPVVEEVLANDPNNFLASVGLEYSAYPNGNLDLTFKVGIIYIKNLYALGEKDANRIEKLFNKQGFNVATY